MRPRPSASDPDKQIADRPGFPRRLDIATLNGTTYMAVNAPAVSQHGLPILGQQVTGYLNPCDLQ